MDLEGNAFVIGASGIGEACALAFARVGARAIIVADLNPKAAKAVAADCKALSKVAGFSAEGVVIDVTSQDSITDAITHAVHTLGRIDYCVNSAGVGVKVANEVAEADIDEFNNMFRVNVDGTFLVLRAMSAIMKSQEAILIDPTSPARGTVRGSIVVIGSASSLVATPKMIQYTAAKHAVLGLTKNAALDNATYGVRVNSVCPSWVDTPMTRKALENVEGLDEMIKSAVPLGRIALPEEVADAVMFLCSPRSSYATGVNLILDGGTTLTSHA